ncbi:MAG: ABC transporter substrate-binding protein [Clostridium sp.]|uniref:ABC transporter substrate-binding protein n=1 Tax=Clostridium sp. TaxID=1506 RepID=UPI00290B69FF|nr:ABC transporter substrate-binding protein [Clostridium sp.]MDU4937897.1 ABC transporter substrate-binding protein [Clostridium sp.]
MKNLKGWIVMLLVAVFSLTTVGCTSKDDLSKESEENRTLKIGLMPAVDTAPILIAEKNGYFKDAGINVEIEIYSNAQNRQSALQSYQIDGAMTDFIAVATNVDGGFDIKATTMTDGMFPVLSNGDVSGKKDIKVGMMEVSVSNYLIDKWLGKDYNIEKVFINEIPARLAAIQSGELDMGLFPEPVASNGELKGLKKNLYGMDDEFSPDCLVFTGKAIAEKEKAIKAFHEAYNKAVDEINKNPQIARDILVEKIPNTNPEVKDIMVLPTYKKAAIPSDEYLQSIIDWTSKTLNKDLTVKPEALLEGKFVK